MDHTKNTESKRIINSYYGNIPQTYNSKFLSPSKILLSARRQSSRLTYLRPKTKSIKTLTEPNQYSITNFNNSLDGQLIRKQFEIEAYGHSKETLESKNKEPIDFQQSILSYQKLYEVPLKDSRARKILPFRSKSTQDQSFKKRKENRFDRTFIKIVNPKFMDKIRLLRKIHINQQDDLPQQIYSAFMKPIIGIFQSPGNRQGCQILCIDKKLYIFGGKSPQYEHCIQYLDMVKNQWFKTEIKGYQRRSFHSCFIHQNSVYQICGYKQPKQEGDERVLSQDMQIINLKTRGIQKYILPKTFKRSNHSSTIYRDALLIVGGINQQGNYLSGGIQFVLKTKKISKLIFEQQFTEGIAYHSLCKGQLGVYLFGGINRNNTLNQNVLFYNKSSDFNKLITQGKRPEPCLKPNLHYLNRLDCIVIYGGKPSLESLEPISQLFIFSQTNHTFSEIKNTKRFFCNSSSTCDENVMYIFGGLNQRGLNNQFYRLEIKYE